LSDLHTKDLWQKKVHLNVGIFIGLKRLASAPFISEDQHLSQDLYIDSNYRKQFAHTYSGLTL